MRLFLFVILLFSYGAQAKRYIVPQDDQVMSQYNQVPVEQALDPWNIRVLVWNMYKGSNKTWSQDFRSLSYEKDILILQEGFTTDTMLNAFKSIESMQFFFATSFIDNKYGGVETGVITAANVQSDEVTWQRSHYREPVIRTPKMTLFTRYSLKGHTKKLLVGNIHGINFVRAFKLRHMLDVAAKRIKKHHGPVVFAGDFNTWTQTKLNNMKMVFKKLGMRSVRFSNDLRKRFQGKILDHVWVRDIEVLEAKVQAVKGSDHNPMEVWMRIY